MKIKLGIFAIILLILGGLCWFFFKDKDTKPELEPDVTEEVEEIERELEIEEVDRSLTTGMDLSEIEAADNYFMVTIENSPMARPQSGLSEADVVYELETEATTTRFLALFNDNKPSKIGPVRSTRHYFLPIADDWNSTYYHFGRSKFADKEFDKMKVEHIDGTYSYGYKYYERDDSRKAPHNAYLITDRLDNEINKPKNTLFEHIGDFVPSGYEANDIKINYNESTRVEYKYDPEKEVYDRFLQDEPHIDTNNDKQINVKNIIFLFAKHENMNTNQGHINIDLNSYGEIFYISGGKFEKGTWKYEDGGMEFLDNNGEFLSVDIGNTWIQVVRDTKINDVIIK